MCGFREGGVGGGLVAVAPVVADVVRHFVVHGRLTGVSGVSGIHRCGQDVVVHFDQLGRVFRRLHRIGDHYRHLVADVACLGMRDHRMGRFVHRCAVDAMDQPAAGQAAHVVSGHIRAGEHRHDAWRLFRRGRIDAFDPRVRMRRAQEHGVGLLGQHDIVGVLSVAGQEPVVFLALDGGANQRMRVGCVHRRLLRR